MAYPHYDKWQIFDLPPRYDRILYLDADIIIRQDCPDLFVMVPPTHVGGENELASYPDQANHLARFMERMGMDQSPCPLYLNAGVLVVSRQHRPLFSEPEKILTDDPWPEQNHFNARLLTEKPPVYFLPAIFNDRRRKGDYLRQSFILHYSVTPLAARIQTARRDLADWEKLFGRQRAGSPFSSAPVPPATVQVDEGFSYPDDDDF